MRDFTQYTVLATGTAALYMMLAQCVVIVHRGSRILNFATGAYAMLGTYLFHDLRQRDWPLGLAAIATVIGVALVGGLTYAVVVRPLRDASLVSRIVATLAIVVVLAELAGLWNPTGGIVEAVLPEHTVHVLGTQVGVDRLILLGIATGLSVLLWALYKFTTFGLATAATSENTRAASALGWSADRIAFFSWSLAGLVAGVAAVLILPVQASLGTSHLTLNIVPALAVALVANFRSFPIAGVAALALAGVQAYLNGPLLSRHPGLKGVDAIVPLIAIVTVLALQGSRIPPRGARSERRPMLGSGTVRPLPLVIALGAILVVLWTILPDDWVSSLSLHATYAMVVLSLVVVLGYAGQLSLGQVALAGVGALIAGRLVATHDWPFGWAVVVGVLGAVVTGALFALPALRTRGLALGIVTLGLGAAVYDFLFTRTYYSPLPGGQKGAGGNFGVTPQGTVIRHLDFFGIELDQFDHPKTYATMCVLVLTLCCLLVSTMRRSRAGLRLVAIRTNERAASSLGINVPAAKLYAFALSAAIAGLGGIMLSFRSHVINYEGDYSPLQSIYAVAFSVVGGVGGVLGAVFGALLFPGTLGAAMGRDFSHWMSAIDHPRPWIAAQIVAGVVYAVARFFTKGKVLAAVVVGGVVAGAAFDDQVGGVLGWTDRKVAILPWAGALFVALLARAVAGVIRRRWKLSKWMPLGVFVVAVVLTRLFAHERVGGWLANAERYLPFIGGILLIDVMLRHGDGLAITVSRLASTMHKFTAKPIELGGREAVPRREHAGSTLELCRVSVTFGGVKAVSQLDLQIRPGEVLGLIGPNGAGKSTVVDAITGYSPLAAGDILLDGESLNSLTAHRRARKGIARTFQNLELFDDITVLENIAAASDTHEVSAYLTGLVRARKPRFDPMALDAIAAFKLEPDLHARAQTMPHGRRRLVAVARAVANHPKVLLLDEPAAGLDTSERAELAQVVRDLADKYGIAVMVIEHDMEFVMSLCDRVAVIDFGRKIAEGTPTEVQASPAVVAAYLGAVDEVPAEQR